MKLKQEDDKLDINTQKKVKISNLNIVKNNCSSNKEINGRNFTERCKCTELLKSANFKASDIIKNKLITINKKCADLKVLSSNSLRMQSNFMSRIRTVYSYQTTEVFGNN